MRFIIFSDQGFQDAAGAEGQETQHLTIDFAIPSIDVDAPIKARRDCPQARAVTIQVKLNVQATAQALSAGQQRTLGQELGRQIHPDHVHAALRERQLEELMRQMKEDGNRNR